MKMVLLDVRFQSDGGLAEGVTRRTTHAEVKWRITLCQSVLRADIISE